MFEYLISNVLEETQAMARLFDSFGRRGWELVAVANGRAYFKCAVQRR